MTNAEDLLVCVWSLETFEMLRRFEFAGVYTEVHVKSIDEAFVVKDGVLGELNFGTDMSNPKVNHSSSSPRSTAT